MMATSAVQGLWRTLGQLPRDSRDTLFLLVVIAWVMLPQVRNLPIWCSLLSAGVLLWRGWLAWGARPLPARGWRFALLMVALAATLMNFRTVLGRDAGVTMIVVLLALKTLELRARRDAFVIFFLSFFAMLTNFFFSQSLLTALAMLVALLGLLTALVNAHMPAGRPPLLLAAQTAGRMALLGAPIMAALFLLFPRLSPLWGIPADGMSGRSGLSGTMQVGTVARLALDDSIALRVRFEGTPPRQADLYFRGPVLSTFDGRDWLPLRSEFPARMRPPANLQVRGEPVRYRVTMEPSNRPWVLVLDAAAMRPALPGYELSLGADLQWQADRPITDLVRYEARSHTEFRHGPPGPVVGLQDYVRLPAGFNPRTLQWAADLRRDPRYANADGARLVDMAMDHLRNGGYAYTLEPGTYGRDSADEFWFDRKQGFCEHIASSFVVLMRALDIPARIVTGYQGGELNAVDGFHVVRQSDAHAWAEVWLPERGWVRVDPTSAVAPGRIGSLERLQAPRGLIASGLVTMSPEMALSLRALWDAVNNRWNQWILNYTQDRQMNLLKDLGFEAPDWQTASYLLIGLVVVVSLGAAAWTMWEVRRQDPWLRLLQRAGRRLAGVGLAVPPHSSARNMAELVRQHLSRDDRNTQALQEWLRRMEVWRYGPPTSQGTTLQALQREFRQLPWPK